MLDFWPLTVGGSNPPATAGGGGFDAGGLRYFAVSRTRPRIRPNTPWRPWLQPFNGGYKMTL